MATLPGAVHRDSSDDEALVPPLEMDLVHSRNAPAAKPPSKPPPRGPPSGLECLLPVDQAPRFEFTDASLPASSPVPPQEPSPGPSVTGAVQWEDDKVTLSRLEEYLAIRQGTQRSCRTMPLTLTLWITLMVSFFVHYPSQESFECAQILESAVQNVEVPRLPKRSARLASLGEARDLPGWLKSGLVPLFSENLVERQRILGMVRMTQTRGHDRPCNLQGNLSEMFRSPCRGSGQPQNDSDTSEDPRIAIGYGPFLQDHTRFPFRTILDSKYVAWLEIGRDPKLVADSIDKWDADKWLDVFSEELAIEALFLNADVNVFLRLDIRFRMHSTGLLEKELRVLPLRADVYSSWGDIFADMLWLAASVVLVCQAVLEMTHAHRKGWLWHYLQDPWIWVDLACILASVAVVVYFASNVAELESFKQSIAKQMTLANHSMPVYSVLTAPDTQKVRAVLDNHNYQGDMSAMLDQSAYVIEVTTWHRHLAFLYSAVLVLRYLRGFIGQPRASVLVQTVLTSREFLFHFALLFLFVLVNFAWTGHMLFGEQLPQWASFGGAVSQLFVILSGKFGYDALASTSPLGAPLWFATFWVSTSLLLLGVLTATILHEYLSIRARLGEPGATLPQQLEQYLADALYSRTYDGSRRSAPPGELLAVLTDLNDPAEYRRIEELGRLQMDRRLRSRMDLDKAHMDPAIDVPWLVERGCDRRVAERLLSQCKDSLRQVNTTSHPEHRLMLMAMRQISLLQREAARSRQRTEARAEWTRRAADRSDLKLCKSVALAKRIKRAQELPNGWSAHVDEDGRRFLKHDASGLTSWTLPKELI